MKISDLTLEQVREGGVWWIPNLEEELIEQRLPLEMLTIVEQDDEDLENLTDEDHVAYVGIRVKESGRVTPLVLIRTIRTGRSGDYCEFVNGSWRQVGLVPNPNAEFSYEYYRNPLTQDPGFDSDSSDSYRKDLQRHFDKWIEHL